MEQTIGGKRLVPLPAGTNITLSSGHYEGTEKRVVILSIGRPIIEETSAGEMVASIPMSLKFAEAFAHRLLDMIEELKGR